MNRFGIIFSLMLVGCATGFSQTSTNISGGANVVFEDLSFAGGAGEAAATISDIPSLDSFNTRYVGGEGLSLSNSSSVVASGGAGLVIDNIDVTTISNTVSVNVLGGKGGVAELSGSSATLSGTALGGSAIDFDASPSTQALTILGGNFVGGEGGLVIGKSPVKLYADGGSAINAQSGGAISLTSGTFTGGKGGTADTEAGLITATGGTGLALAGSYNLAPLGSGVSITGGAGGNIVNTATVDGDAQAFGGHGVVINSTTATPLSFSGGTYAGGKGGTASFDSDDVANPFSEKNYFGTYFGAVEDINGAKGGHGLRIYNEEYDLKGTVLNITDGTFIGGDGGVSDNAGSGDSIADGGHGIFTDYVDLNIYGGTFRGGAAGTSNNDPASAGAGIYARDSNVLITNGTFEGKGLLFESHYFDSTATLQGGTFDDAVFYARSDEY